tara:strand:+ start:125 stop:1006 length:882 start_codon:yes stop_codon:yes gene_type:complete
MDISSEKNNDGFRLTIDLLKSVLPDVDYMLADMEENKGWLKFPDDFIQTISDWKLPPWSDFYLDERKLKVLPLLTLYDVETLKNVSDESRDEFLLQAKRETLEAFQVTEEIKPPSLEEVEKRLGAANEEEKLELTKQMVLTIYTVLVSTFNYLSLMTFGRTIYQLLTVAQSRAKEADKALCQAVQIDRTILQLDFVKDRILRAQLTGDIAFLDQLARHIKSPILGKKIRYRKLWLTFAILEDEIFLDIPHEQLLDLLQELGVYGKSFGVEDVGHLRNRLFEYRKKSPLGQKEF